MKISEVAKTPAEICWLAVRTLRRGCDEPLRTIGLAERAVSQMMEEYNQLSVEEKVAIRLKYSSITEWYIDQGHWRDLE